MDRVNVQLPIADKIRMNLKAGDLLSLSGVVYTARDAAHKRLVEAINTQQPLPFDLTGQAIYYTGPCPACPGQVIGSAGPTTSGRMDSDTPILIERGLRVMIGKGQRSDTVSQAMIQYGAVYLGATGGAGALLAQHITASDIIAYPDLGTEAIRRLVVRDFPVIVLIDSQGNNLYEIDGALSKRKISDLTIDQNRQQFVADPASRFLSVLEDDALIPVLRHEIAA